MWGPCPTASPPVPLSDLALRVQDARRRHRSFRREVGLPASSSTQSYWDGLLVGLAPRRRLLFYPELPPRWSVAGKLCVALRYAVSGDVDREADVAVWYQNATLIDGDRSVLPPGLGVINGACHDISKRRVAEAFERVFGYPLAVDPTIYDGPMVEKSDANYRHDGVVVEGPIAAPRPDRVYQVCVDAREDDAFVDYRTHVSGGEIPVVYRKTKPLGRERFTEITGGSLVDPEAVYSAEERRGLVGLCEEMGADFAELDVLRDTATSRIYVVDVNVTPSGPKRGLVARDRQIAVRRMAASFERLVAAKL